MTKAERGTKRVCASCGGKFYDLNRDPITCPMCQAVFTVEKPAASPAVPEAEEEAEADTTAQAAAAVAGPEIISLEDAEAEEAGDAGALGDEDDVDVVDLEGDDDIPEPEEEDAFLEEDDEEETDVSGIIGSPIEGNEET